MLRRTDLLVLCVTLSLLVLSSTLGYSQTGNYTQIGIPENNPQIPIPLGFINPLTEQVHLEIPVATMPTRNGVPAKAYFQYDTAPWLCTTQGGVSCTVSHGNAPGFAVTSDTQATLISERTAGTCPSGYTGVKDYFRFFRVLDTSGAHYILSTGTSPPEIITENCTSPNGQHITTSPQSISLPSADGEYYFSLRAGQTDGSNCNCVWSVDGSFVLGVPSAPPYDTNGNYLVPVQPNPLPTQLADYTTNPVSGMLGGSNGSCYKASSSTLYVYATASDGTRQTYTIGCTNYTLSGGGAIDVMTSLTLPDGSKYLFSYDSAHEYVLSGVTLPTGGQMSFTYSTGLTPPLTSATFNGGTWTFSQTSTTSNGFITQSTTVMSPPRYDVASQSYVSDKSIYSSNPWNGNTANNYYLGQAQFFSGTNTLLKTVNATYSTAAFPYNCLISLSTTLNDTGQTANTTYQYGQSCSLVTQKQESDYTGTAIRTTVISYLGDTPSIKYNSQYHIYNRPASVAVYAGAATSGTPLRATTYSYDEYGASYCKAFNGAPVPMLTNITGAINHDDSGHGVAFTARGNVTSVSGLISGTIYTTSHTCYDTLGNVTQQVDGKGNPTNFSYADNWADTTCEASGTITREQPTTVTDALGHRRQTKIYSCTRLPAAVADENDLDASPVRSGTTYTYDFAGRPLCIGYSDGGQTCNSYFMAASPAYVTQTSSINAGSNEALKTVFDPWNNVAQQQLVSDPEGIDYTDTTYDAVGRPASVSNSYRSTTDSTYGITTNYYDALSRTTEVLKADGSKVVSSYSGNCTTVTDEVGKGRKSCTDALGRLTGVWEDPNALNYETDYSYSPVDDLITVTQKGGAASSSWRTRSFQYDDLSRLIQAVNPESGTINYTYDANGGILTKTAPSPNQPSGGTATVTTSYSYDPLNRLTQRSYVDSYSINPATATVQYGYDGNALTGCTTAAPTLADTNPIGYRTSMCDGSGATSWAHDPLGRVATEKRTIVGTSAWTKTAGYTYNLDGSIATISNPGVGRVMTYATSGAGRQTSLVNTGGNINFVTSATYAPSGELATYTNGGVITTTNSYNARLQPATLSAVNSSTGQTITSFTYDFHSSTHADNGSVFQIVNGKDGNRTQNFLYDSLNRIEQSYTNGPNWGETFGPTAANPGTPPSSSGIDAWGNLTNRSGVNGKALYEPLSAAPASNQNRLPGYGYDAAGNIISNGSASYTYDSESRLITTAGWTYVYDGDGRRVRKSSGSSGTLYYPDLNGNVLNESSLGATNLHEYVYFNGMRVARIDVPTPLTVKYYFSDHLGSASVVTDSSGNILKEADYYPYGGEIVVAGSDGNNYKFTGKERDSESSLDYFGARHYVPALGRFMTPDPTRLSAFFDSPQTWNGYAYAHNDPTVYVDINGEWPADIHNIIIDTAFPNLTADQKELLKQVSAHQDSILSGGQGNSLAFQHAMRGPGQSVQEAEADYNTFVSLNEDQATKDQINFSLSGNTGYSNKALTEFAAALHAITDSTSPAHSGFQLWDWRRPGLVRNHVSRESTITPQQLANAVSAAQAAFIATFRPYSKPPNLDEFDLLEILMQESQTQRVLHESVTHKVCYTDAAGDFHCE